MNRGSSIVEVHKRDFTGLVRRRNLGQGTTVVPVPLGGYVRKYDSNGLPVYDSLGRPVWVPKTEVTP